MEFGPLVISVWRCFKCLISFICMTLPSKFCIYIFPINFVHVGNRGIEPTVWWFVFIRSSVILISLYAEHVEFESTITRSTGECIGPTMLMFLISMPTSDTMGFYDIRFLQVSKFRYWLVVNLSSYTNPSSISIYVLCVSCWPGWVRTIDLSLIRRVHYHFATGHLWISLWDLRSPIWVTKPEHRYLCLERIGANRGIRTLVWYSCLEDRRNRPDYAMFAVLSQSVWSEPFS